MHAQGARRTLLVVGDSLSAEYGIARGSGWVALLEQRIAQQKLPVRVVNASISGDTTSGGRSRLPALLQQHRPQVVVIALGGNDALRGLPLDMTQANLTAMARAAKAAGAKVLIAGIAVPPNYGRKYGEDFVRALRHRGARARAPRWCPSCWRAWPTRRTPTTLFQPDRIHPTAAGAPADARQRLAGAQAAAALSAGPAAPRALQRSCSRGGWRDSGLRLRSSSRRARARLGRRRLRPSVPPGRGRGRCRRAGAAPLAQASRGAAVRRRRARAAARLGD